MPSNVSGATETIVPEPTVFGPKTQVFRPTWVRAGFHADCDTGPDGSGLVHAGEQWAPPRMRIAGHAHPVWEFYLQLHGESSWHAGAKQFTLGSGDLLGVAPRVRHEMRHAATRTHHFCFAAVDLDHVLRRHTDLAADWRDPPPALHVAGSNALAEAFHQLCRELTAARRHSRTGLVLAVDRLVLEVTRRVRDRPVPILAAHPAVAAARQLLDRDSARRWTVDDLAREVGLAPGYLGMLFAREVGLTPHRYLTERRVNHAQLLLATADLSVTAIGLAVGFGSGQHFARVFRQITGMTPGEHRRALGLAAPAGAVRHDQAGESRNGKWRPASKIGTG